MMIIKRIPTVLSNYQEDDSAEPRGCGRNCLGKCCLPVSKLPLYSFKGDADPRNSSAGTDEPPPDFFLNSLLLGQWEDRMSRGLFRYDVTACETKVIPGGYGFIAQLNEGRHLKKRPTEFRIDRVLQPFDPSKFNFTKVGQEEVLFCFEAESATVCEENSFNVVAINVSPIEYGHVLLIPLVPDCYRSRLILIVSCSLFIWLWKLEAHTLGLATIAWVPLQPSITCISRLLFCPCLFLRRELLLKEFQLLKVCARLE